MQTNDELENSIISNRRPTKENEFIFPHMGTIGHVERMFNYIEENSNLKIETIGRDELPMNTGVRGYRIIKT